MIPSINLRGDLAKLSDTELAERLEAAWRAYDACRKERWWFFRSRFLPVRGPIRHPRLYRFRMLLFGGGSDFWSNLLLAGFFSSKKYERRLREDLGADAHLHMCEIKDINDEIKRRLAAMRGST